MIKMSRSFYKENIKINNSIINNSEKITENNENIIEYLYALGENSAAKYLEENINTNNYSNNIKELTDAQLKGNLEVKKLSEINSGILEKLSELEQNIIDEQDTSVAFSKKTESKNQNSKKLIEQNQNSTNNISSWFSGLLGMFLGAGMLSFLKGFATLGPLKFALKIVEMGWDSIKTKVIDVAQTIAKKISEPLEKVIQYLSEKLNKVIQTLEKITGKIFDTGKKIGNKVVDTGKKVSKKINGKISPKMLGITALVTPTEMGNDDYIQPSTIPFLKATTSNNLTEIEKFKEDGMTEQQYRISKMKSDGIIDVNYFSKDDIDNWDKLNELSDKDLEALINYDGFSDKTIEKISEKLYKRVIEKVKVPESVNDRESMIKMVFDDSDIEASKLLSTNNKLQSFLLQHPLIDENIIKEETEINGEKVTKIKYKDDELNEEYLKLKEEYDNAYKIFKEKRYNQIKNMENMENITEIEGEYLTNEQLNEYKNNKNYSGMSVQKYMEVQNTRQAEQDVSERLKEQYKNIAIPTSSLEKRIKDNEGYSLTPYRDSLGYWTIGYGHLIKPNEQYLMNGITAEQAEELFKMDYTIHRNAAEKIPSFNEQPESIKDVLTDMTYNMGPNWYKDWPSFIKNLQNKNYQANADIILDSKYATQVKNRALVNAKIFESEMAKKQASSNVNEVQVSQETNTNINNLTKNNSIETKVKQVQNVEENSRNLAQTSKVFIQPQVVSNGNQTITNTVASNNTIEYSKLFNF